jgi:hypothetical protein
MVIGPSSSGVVSIPIEGMDIQDDVHNICYMLQGDIMAKQVVDMPSK